MKRRKTVLFLSNGHGEDAVAVAILKKLVDIQPDLIIKAMPVVGCGRAYTDIGVETIGPKENLPSGGFLRLSLSNLIKDLRAGLLRITFQQIYSLLQVSKEVDLVVVCGDVFLLLLAVCFVKRKTVFIATAKSEAIHGHFVIEKKIMRKFAARVYTRDPETAGNLTMWGVPASFLGNAMMDGIEFSNHLVDIFPPTGVIGFLPGTREDSGRNIIYFLNVIDQLEAIYPKKLSYGISFYPGLSISGLVDQLKECGWSCKSSEERRGIWYLVKKETKVIVIQGNFGDFLKVTEIVVGLSGTGNEQAAGMGKPVITFHAKSIQCTEKFIKAQKKLLGDSLAVTKSEPMEIAWETINILEDRSRYEQMSRCGRNRMGSTGGAKRIAAEISGFL